MEGIVSYEFEKKMISELSEKAKTSSYIDPGLFQKFQVKRGLRDIDGKGVLVGLTEIGEVHSYIIDEGEIIPVPGRLIYRGIDINDLVAGFLKDDRYGFEETCYLLLFGDLPNRDELGNFRRLISSNQKLPEDFASDIIMRATSKNVMNTLARSVLALYSFDKSPEDTSIDSAYVCLPAFHQWRFTVTWLCPITTIIRACFCIVQDLS